jgi:hypothetical protein
VCIVLNLGCSPAHRWILRGKIEVVLPSMRCNHAQRAVIDSVTPLTCHYATRPCSACSGVSMRSIGLHLPRSHCLVCCAQKLLGSTLRAAAALHSPTSDIAKLPRDCACKQSVCCLLISSNCQYAFQSSEAAHRAPFCSMEDNSSALSDGRCGQS